MKMINKCFEILQTCWRTFLKFACPPIYLLLYSKKSQHKVLKTICGFIYGILLGIGFYELILVDLNFTANASILTGMFLCFLLGLGCALSIQIRCISVLTIPSLCGSAGRGVLKALVLAYIIAGPFQNLTNNGKEVIRVFACTTSLTYNLTKNRFELMFKPFQTALFGMKTDVSEIKDTLKSIRDITAPITSELENEAEMKKLKEENDYIDKSQQDSSRSDDIDKKYQIEPEEIEAEKYEKKYLQKLEYRCEDQLSRAAKKCRDIFSNAYDSCYNKVTWAAAWLLCWPMKLTFVCNIAEAMSGSKACNAKDKMDSGFGVGYGYLKNVRSQFGESLKDVKLQYQISKIKPVLDVQQATDTARSVLHDFKEKKYILDSFLLVIKRLLAFVFLKIILSAQKYHDEYLSNLDFDNIYISRYFRKIDARRNSREQHTLLPLKKIERQKLVDEYSVVLLKNERREIVGATVKLLLEMITATTFILLDRLLYEALDMVRRHSFIEYTQVGHHDLMINVKGTGMIASILRSVIKGFNIKKRIKTVHNNAACLPNPSLMPHYYFYKIYGTYISVWLLLILEAYTQRTRHAICSYFYPKREKKRILHLYNNTLKKRLGIFRHMKKKIQILVRKRRLEEELNAFNVLRVRFPNMCNWLKVFAAARRKCIICGDREPLKKRDKILHDFERCGNAVCYVVYCAECWHDLGASCMACEPWNDDSDTDDSDEIS